MKQRIRKTSNRKNGHDKYHDILEAAKKLFLEKGYERTTVRDIVREAGTSMGNLYFHFPNKSAMLKIICRDFVGILRQQIYRTKSLAARPEVGFALDFKIGYITTLEDQKLSQLWLLVREYPDIHQYSLENKRIRLMTFFGDHISPDELNSIAIAIQGIADAFYEQKKEGHPGDQSRILSNLIIDYSLRLLGYSKESIQVAIEEAEEYIQKQQISVNQYFKFQNAQL